jgi:hypothetical protein
MKKKYLTPKISMKCFNTEDVLTISDEDNVADGSEIEENGDDEEGEFVW